MEKAILEIFEDWEKKLEIDEWYFQNSYESLVDGLSSEEAYKNIPAVIRVLLNTKNNFLIGETLEILIGIYNIADTTEIHPYLRENKVEIGIHIHTYADDQVKEVYNELKSLLRIS
ncbi:ABC transporter [Gracilibacillus suaedae]|uniref:ABC transporter n=1 Tax=Gracilibacillus suaedae TaxID=2820273 RepID=UPI001ABEAF14|nr:ABC transporter [Gracilibacillus suaedae]